MKSNLRFNSHLESLIKSPALTMTKKPSFLLCLLLIRVGDSECYCFNPVVLLEPRSHCRRGDLRQAYQLLALLHLKDK